MKTLFVLTFVSPTKRSPDDEFKDENDRLIFTNKWMVKIEQNLFSDLYPHNGKISYNSDIVVFPELFAGYLKKISIGKGVTSKFFRSYVNRYVRKYRREKVERVANTYLEKSICESTWGAVVFIGVQDEVTWDLWYEFFETQTPDGLATYEFNIDVLETPLEPRFFWLEKDSLLTRREACAVLSPEGYLRACPLNDNNDYQASNGAKIIHTGQAYFAGCFIQGYTTN